MLKMLQHFQDLSHSFSLYGPPSRQITYISLIPRPLSSMLCSPYRLCSLRHGKINIVWEDARKSNLVASVPTLLSPTEVVALVWTYSCPFHSFNNTDKFPKISLSLNKNINEELWQWGEQQTVGEHILRRAWAWIGHTLRKAPKVEPPRGKRGRPRNSWRRDTDTELKMIG